MIRPDDIVTAVGGRVMEGAGVPFLQNGRIGQDNLSSFTRTTRAWTRVQRAKWAQVSTDTPRYGLVNVGGEYRLGLVLESSGTNAFRLSGNLTGSSGGPWIPLSTLGGRSSAPSVLEGREAVKFSRPASSTANYGVYQDLTTPSTRWASFSVTAEEGSTAPLQLRIRNQSSSAVAADLSLAWDGTVTATRSTEGGASTLAPVLGLVEPLGFGPNGGRAYRATLSLRLPGNHNLRCTVFPCGVAASTGLTVCYLHHAQFDDRSGPREVNVGLNSTAVFQRGAESLKIPAVNMPGGAMTLYQENVLRERPGSGTAAPAASTDATAVFLALAKGWSSTAGDFIGGGQYARGGESIVAGATGQGLTPGDRVEQLVSVSTGGQLVYQVRVNGGKVFRASSPTTLTPAQQSKQPSYTLAQDQVLLLSVLARGVHDLDDFTSLFP